ncbi:MAG: PEP-CTERM sorting domain-containing protein, partial [Planctomycetaceae bacterium]
LNGHADAAQPYYNLRVSNNFGAGEYYGATVSGTQIWLMTNFQFDYLSSGSFTTGNASPTGSSYANPVALSQIQSGSVRIYPTNGGTRMYAILSSTQPPSFSAGALPSGPASYWEWSFDGSGNPGTLDLSWIDSWDFQTRMRVVTTGTQGPSSPNGTTVVYGAGTTNSTQAIGDRLKTYAAQPKYTWLGTTGSGFSQNMSFPGATGPVRWITNNSAASPNAALVTSLKDALDRITTTATASPTWAPGTPGTGPNWTTGGFRVASTEGINPPDGSTPSATPSMWSAYVNFSKDGGGNYTMNLTDFTVYGPAGASGLAGGPQIWNSGTLANGSPVTYSLSQAEGLLDALWTSSPNPLQSPPPWVGNLGPNGPNLFYALYNAVATGVLYQSDFVGNTALPGSITGNGYVPWTTGQTNYNMEILTQGAAVTGGRAGALNGTQVIALMEAEKLAGNLVNPYFLELLKSQEQTPAYLYPSQDFYASAATGTDSFIGMQTGPLNGDPVFGAATLEWSLGSGVAVPEPSALALLSVAGVTLGGLAWRRRRHDAA